MSEWLRVYVGMYVCRNGAQNGSHTKSQNDQIVTTVVCCLCSCAFDAACDARQGDRFLLRGATDLVRRLLALHSVERCMHMICVYAWNECTHKHSQSDICQSVCLPCPHAKRHIHTHMNTHTHTYIHTNTHTHTHAHTFPPFPHE